MTEPGQMPPNDPDDTDPDEGLLRVADPDSTFTTGVFREDDGPEHEDPLVDQPLE